MVDDPPKPRKRGRPPKPVEEIVRRPTVGLRLRQELYDQVVEAAQKNGRSLSEEMEARVELAFSTTAADMAAAAAETARRQEDDAYLKEFHGLDGMLWGKASADLYRRELTKLVLETGWTSGQDMPEGFADKLLERTRAGLSFVVEEWHNSMLMSQMLSKLKDVDIGPLVDRMLELNPELQRKLEDFTKRRSDRSRAGSKGSDDEG